MDKFSVSIQAHHELSQQEPALPRSYLVEACQQSLDDKWDVTRTPGECPGAEISFKVLLENELRKYVSTKMLHKFNLENGSYAGVLGLKGTSALVAS